MPHPAATRCWACSASPGLILYCKHGANAAEADDDFEAGPSDEEQELSGGSGSDASGSEGEEEAGGSEGEGEDGEEEEEEEEDDFGSGECKCGAAARSGVVLAGAGSMPQVCPASACRPCGTCMHACEVCLPPASMAPCR